MRVDLPAPFADQSHDVALGQVEGHVVQREAGIIVFGDVGDLQRHRVGFGYGGHGHGPFSRLFLAVFLFEHAVQCVQRNAGGFGAPACLGQAFANLGFELTLHQFVALVHHEVPLPWMFCTTPHRPVRCTPW